MKFDSSAFARKLLIAGMLTAALVAAPAATVVFTPPAAHADGGVPDPGPEPLPQPVAQPDTGGGGCQQGEVSDPNTGDCIPAMAGATSTAGDMTEDVPTPRLTQNITESSETGVASNLVPNINGDSCTGYWQSVACSEMEQDNVTVRPRTTISSSP